MHYNSTCISLRLKIKNSKIIIKAKKFGKLLNIQIYIKKLKLKEFELATNKSPLPNIFICKQDESIYPNEFYFPYIIEEQLYSIIKISTNGDGFYYFNANKDITIKNFKCNFCYQINKLG